MLTISKAAKLLDVHPSTLRAWADRGIVPVSRLPSGHRRFTAEQVEEIKANMIEEMQNENLATR